MPSSSAKQHRFMEAIAHSPSFAKKAGVPQSVGKDFAAADKGKTFKKGGNVKKMALGGETTEDKKVRDRLANMREEESEVQNERKRRETQEDNQRYRRGIGMMDLKAAQKQGKTYDKWFEDNRKAQLKEGILRKDAYDEGKGFEMLTPAQHREAMVSGYKKGGEMKESKAMTAKEVAFMKKKGAPKSMLKHEEAEGMKKGGSAKYMSFTDKGKPAGMKPVQKVRRMADGGLGSSEGYGDPFAKPRDYEAEKERGAKTMRGIKDFFGFGDKEEPVEEVKPAPVRATRSSATPAAAPAATSRVTTPMVVKNPESDDNERKIRGPQNVSSVSDRGEGELSGDGLSPVQRPKAQLKQPQRRPVGIEKTVKQERVITEPVDTSRAAIEERRAAERKLAKPESKSASKFGLASDETREAVRKGLGSVLNFFDLSKAHEREFGKKMAKGGNVKETMGPRSMSMDVEKGSNKSRAFGEHAIQKRGKTRDLEEKMPKFAKGGMVSSRGDGIAQRGRTRGKLC